jgi:hypothetical protein
MLQRASTAIRGFLADRVPSWMRQTAPLILIYVGVMWALAHWLSAWHDWDWSFFDRLERAPASLRPEIALVDMQYSNTLEIPKHREMLADFIRTAAKQRPLAIILDIPFGQCTPVPCGEQMAASRRIFTRAVEGAERASVPVYANVGEISLTPEGLPDGAAPALDPQIYADLSGYGHTAVVVLRTRETDRSGDLFYDPCYPLYPALFGAGNPQDVWALVDVVLYHDELLRSPKTHKLCDPNTAVPVRYGPAVADRPPAEYQISESSRFPRGASFFGKYVIVGVPKFDRNPEMTHRPGSELLAWLFSDELNYQHFEKSTVLVQGSSLRVLVPAFSSVTVLAFVAWFFLLKRLPLGPGRTILPHLSAVLSFCVGAAALVAFETWMFRGPPHQVQPQVALISLGIVLAATLCGVRGAQIEFELRNKIDSTGPPEQYDYDVFISYAHEELAWVLERVYVPFQNARLRDGSRLKLYFDTSTIRTGTAWQDSISLSIDGSRFIVPVYSDIYFRKPYCRFEIKRAHRKWIREGEESGCVLPVMRGRPRILQVVDDIQAVSIDDRPDLVERIIAEIVDRLSAKTPGSQEPSASPAESSP